MFCSKPSSKFSTYRVKVTATERPLREERWGGPGAQLSKEKAPGVSLPTTRLLPSWMNTLPAVFITSGSFKSPPLGTFIPFLRHQVPRDQSRATSPSGLSLFLLISAGRAQGSQDIPGVSLSLAFIFKFHRWRLPLHSRYQLQVAYLSCSLYSE